MHPPFTDDLSKKRFSNLPKSQLVFPRIYIYIYIYIYIHTYYMKMCPPSWSPDRYLIIISSSFLWIQILINIRQISFFSSVLGCHIELNIYDEIDPLADLVTEKKDDEGFWPRVRTGDRWIQLLGIVCKGIHLPKVVKERCISIQGTAINQKEIKAFKNNKAGDIFWVIEPSFRKQEMSVSLLVFQPLFSVWLSYTNIRTLM